MIPTVSVIDLVKDYPTRQGPRRILDHISFVLPKGQRLGILGCNGAGKSTLIRLISGAEMPTSGEIRRTMTVSWPLAFQGAFASTLSGLDNLRFICRIYDVSFPEALESVAAFSELGRYLEEPLSSYSAGMRARLAFAISMAVDFDCYLIDEISAVGDKRFNAKCKQEMFNRKNGRSIVMVSHFAGVIKEYCDTFAVLDRGRLRTFSDLQTAMAYYDEVMSKHSIAF